MSTKLKPCPFCGGKMEKPDFPTNQGTKWGRIECDTCCACGPEVRTGYDVSENADWHKEAIEEWNKRASA